MEANKTKNKIRVNAVWREMVIYALDQNWHNVDRFWFYGERLLCQLLGFGNEHVLLGLSRDTVKGMLDVYERWAREHLAIDEENIARFANFLTSEIGSVLRLQALPWLAKAVTESTHFKYRHRETTTQSLIDFASKTIQMDVTALKNDPVARDSLIQIIAELAALNIPAALTLQERVKFLR